VINIPEAGRSPAVDLGGHISLGLLALESYQRAEEREFDVLTR